MAERKYVRRRRERVADEIAGVRALRGPLPASARVADLGAVLAARWRPFERAGWTAVESESLENAHTDERAQSDAARVLVDQGGQVVLFPGVLTVRFHAGVSDGRVRELLSEVGAQLVEALPLADNMFRVRVLDRDRDPFEAAATLSSMAECDFAEPEFVEPIAHRPT